MNFERIVSRPSVELWLRQVRERKAASETHVLPSEILRARDQERTALDVDGGQRRGSGPAFESYSRLVRCGRRSLCTAERMTAPSRTNRTADGPTRRSRVQGPCLRRGDARCLSRP